MKANNSKPINSDDPQDDIFILAWGLVCMSVCAPKGMDIEEVEKLANSKQPTGISSRWAKSDDPNFATGQPQGCDCDQMPETRRHFLLNC
jgi:hypothetical protein